MKNINPGPRALYFSVKTVQPVIKEIVLFTRGANKNRDERENNLFLLLLFGYGRKCKNLLKR